ncbi:MAG: hypothetical protein F4Y45_01365 [Acidobacteria bacterium]|nr:hypothetical protein [Acidobacteriota bacterium]MXZ70671.1 hypothetical protein [Acidobacteriota bacterium]MYD72481.1 hypothetical protein [Acidobacteriota bacterium]MYJ05679.1 hypothetical protein [Acidobacteriota bacterium]
MGGSRASGATPPERVTARGNAEARAGLAEVRAGLQGYADRGVFRGLAERPARGGRLQFSFGWLAPDPFTLLYDPAAGTLTFRDLLPNVGSRTPLAAALRKFIQGRTSPALPPHRRIDPRRAGVRCSIRRGALTVEVLAKPSQHGYGVNRAVNLVNELFVHLQTYHPEYMWENFDAPQE